MPASAVASEGFSGSLDVNCVERSNLQAESRDDPV